MKDTFYDLMRRQGITRRSFLKFCSLTAASLGLGAEGSSAIAQAMQTKPRTPVIWIEGLECTCCSESFIRSAHPLAKDAVLSMLSLDYHMTLSAAAGHQLHENARSTMEKYKGNYILAVEGNPPLAEDGMYCIYYGKPFVESLKEYAKNVQEVYLGCLEQEKTAAIAAIDAADPEYAAKKSAVEAIHAKKHNSALDELQATIDRWNVEKKAFADQGKK